MTHARLGWGALVVAAAGGHLVYPAFLSVASRGRSTTPPADPPCWPAVSVVIPAYREAGVIAQKISHLRGHDYPASVEIIVIADDDDATAAVARDAGATVLSHAERRGKAQAINAGVAAAHHRIIVLTDANNELLPGSLKAMVRWFADPAVAAVAGEKVESDENEQLYWRFESWLKVREAALGTTIGLVGELAALRASSWRPIPVGIGTDDLWIALDMAERGGVVAYEPRARAVDPSAGSLRVQWERRTRSVSGAMNVFRTRSHLLGPSGGLVAVEIWGHRLWRYTFGPIAHAAVLAGAARHARRSRVAQAVLVVHAAAAIALPLQQNGRSVPLPLRAASHGLFLHAVALGGLVRYVRGERGIIWPTVSR
ncbi:MAG: glycosyltransferase [Actinomycetota bacterium]|nr:glycosyltransferase [Actinomycetota bacterium]